MVARFDDLNERRLAREAAFSRKLGPQELWSLTHQYPLYAGEYWIARILKIADLLRTTLDIPGNVVEFGSWQGANLLYLAKLLRIYDSNSAKRVYGFDSFEGLVTIDPRDGVAERYRGVYQGSYGHLLEVIELFEMEREIVIHRGDITESLPRVLSAQPALRFSFVYCDVDLYSPTAVILREVHDRLNVGGLLVVDEYGLDEFPGEQLAVDEFLAEHAADYEVMYLRDTRQPGLALKRLG